MAPLVNIVHGAHAPLMQNGVVPLHSVSVVQPVHIPPGPHVGVAGLRLIHELSGDGRPLQPTHSLRVGWQ